MLFFLYCFVQILIDLCYVMNRTFFLCCLCSDTDWFYVISVVAESSMTVYIRKTIAKNNRPANENEKGSKSTLVSTSTSSGSDGERRRGKTPKVGGSG